MCIFFPCSLLNQRTISINNTEKYLFSDAFALNIICWCDKALEGNTFSYIKGTNFIPMPTNLSNFIQIKCCRLIKIFLLKSLFKN